MLLNTIRKIKNLILNDMSLTFYERKAKEKSLDVLAGFNPDLADDEEFNDLLSHAKRLINDNSKTAADFVAWYHGLDKSASPKEVRSSFSKKIDAILNIAEVEADSNVTYQYASYLPYLEYDYNVLLNQAENGRKTIKDNSTSIQSIKSGRAELNKYMAKLFDEEYDENKQEVDEKNNPVVKIPMKMSEAVAEKVDVIKSHINEYFTIVDNSFNLVKDEFEKAKGNELELTREENAEFVDFMQRRENTLKDIMGKIDERPKLSSELGDRLKDSISKGIIRDEQAKNQREATKTVQQEPNVQTVQSQPIVKENTNTDNKVDVTPMVSKTVNENPTYSEVYNQPKTETSAPTVSVEPVINKNVVEPEVNQTNTVETTDEKQIKTDYMLENENEQQFFERVMGFEYDPNKYDIRPIDGAMDDGYDNPITEYEIVEKVSDNNETKNVGKEVPQWDTRLTEEQILEAYQRDIYEPVGREYEMFLSDLGLSPIKNKTTQVVNEPVVEQTVPQWDPRLTEEQILDAYARDIYEPVGREYEMFLSDLGLSPIKNETTPIINNQAEEQPVVDEEPTVAPVEEVQPEQDATQAYTRMRTLNESDYQRVPVTEEDTRTDYVNRFVKPEDLEEDIVTTSKEVEKVVIPDLSEQPTNNDRVILNSADQFQQAFGTAPRTEETPVEDKPTEEVVEEPIEETVENIEETPIVTPEDEKVPVEDKQEEVVVEPIEATVENIEEIPIVTPEVEETPVEEKQEEVQTLEEDQVEELTPEVIPTDVNIEDIVEEDLEPISISDVVDNIVEDNTLEPQQEIEETQEESMEVSNETDNKEEVEETVEIPEEVKEEPKVEENAIQDAFVQHVTSDTNNSEEDLEMKKVEADVNEMLKNKEAFRVISSTKAEPKVEEEVQENIIKEEPKVEESVIEEKADEVKEETKVKPHIEQLMEYDQKDVEKDFYDVQTSTDDDFDMKNVSPFTRIDPVDSFSEKENVFNISTPEKERTIREDYKVVAHRRLPIAKYLSAVAGAACAIFGVAAEHPQAFVGAAAGLTVSALLNINEINRAVRKHQIKRMFVNTEYKPFFCLDGKIRLLNSDMSELTEEQKKEANEILENSRKFKYRQTRDNEVPLVTSENLENAFNTAGNKVGAFHVSKKDIREYEDALAIAKRNEENANKEYVSFDEIHSDTVSNTKTEKSDNELASEFIDAIKDAAWRIDLIAKSAPNNAKTANNTLEEYCELHGIDLAMSERVGNFKLTDGIQIKHDHNDGESDTFLNLTDDEIEVLKFIIEHDAFKKKYGTYEYVDGVGIRGIEGTKTEGFSMSVFKRLNDDLAYNNEDIINEVNELKKDLGRR